MRVPGAALLALVITQVATAQRLTGIVRDTANGLPLSGAVVSVLDGAHTTLSRAISDEAGRYSVPLGATASDLRVVRLGYQPVTLPAPKERAPVASLDIVMTRVATLLSAVAVNDARICSDEHDRGKALSLWEQARAALLASVVARESQPAMAMTMSYERVVDRDEMILKQRATIHTGSTKRPYVADSAIGLARRGYLDIVDGARVFKAPDADVLLDDSFAETHCFSLGEPDPAHAGMVGLGFEPAKGRDHLVDIRGTLWIDPQLPELKTVEYGYTGENGRWERQRAGGVIEFRTMSNGVVFVAAWKVRLPALASAEAIRGAVRGRAVADPPVTQVSESGGMVLSATWTNELHYQAPLGPMEGVVRDEYRKPIPHALVIIPATGDSIAADESGHFSFSPILPGRYALQVADTSYFGYFEARATSALADIAVSRASNVQATVAPLNAALNTVCGGVLWDGQSVLLGRLVDSKGDRHAPDDTRINASWLAGKSATTIETQTVNLDRTGRFAICGVARNVAVHLDVRRPGVTFADTSISIHPDSAMATMKWSADMVSLLQAWAPRMAELRGRVTRTDAGTPIDGVDVWLPSLDRHALSGSNGEYRFPDMPAGHVFLQTRRIGFAVQRDTLSLAGGLTTSHDIALVPQTQVLDTIRTVATAGKWISPGLRGFEDRRATSATGYFIADSVMRLSGGRSLASIALSRMPGMTLRAGRAGAQYLVSTRKRCMGTVMSACDLPNCYVTIYLDGALMYSATTSAPPEDASRIQADELAGAEFYATGAAPPQFNSTDSGCGTLLLWSRER